MRGRAWGAAALGLALGGCAALGGFLNEFGTERPPAPLDEATVASDARLDPSGAVAGSFVGEGTSRAVHLLSSDTALIGALARRYRPVDARRDDTWEWLATQRSVVIPLDPARDSVLRGQHILVGSPEGHTPVRLESITLRAPSCGPLGAQAELVVRETGASRGPSLRGPVVGAFFAPDDYYAALNRAWRDPIPDPTSALEDSLVGWTRRAMDSLVALRATARDLPLTPAPAAPLALNGLEDDDAADLQPFRLDDGRIRYAVSLRERRRTAQGTEVLAAIVMAWDATGAWQQVIFRPTLLEYRRNRLVRGHGTTPPLFWRRLAPVSGFAYGRDYLWMEQVDVEAGRVLWVILEPRSNTVVAAADMDGPC
ncbi:MAG: hypothetical protein IPI38_14480 [Gemmatimonadetes bacterium]|nr:hypothetical protein [Gemmatimonadota bacterium]MBP9198572.1 hypothetical protein [Gemmatimonadales bacterium]MBK6781374.1 hypothetical protein [Gemmatimonadota bacterium]MBK7349801.1 hypothetical protein [Gemmatimonadota bacterium]MBK7716611.1 hypothetical protein [Gemmatimonadota bacterium]